MDRIWLHNFSKSSGRYRYSPHNGAETNAEANSAANPSRTASRHVDSIILTELSRRTRQQLEFLDVALCETPVELGLR